jgi:hypothetical protein
MNNIQTILLKCFINCPKVIVSIIFEYVIDFFKMTNIHFKNSKINTIKQLTNNRIAIGFADSILCVYNLSNKEPLFKKLEADVLISAFCQLDDNTLVVGFSNRDYFFIWNYVNGTDRIMRLPKTKYCGNDSIIKLENNILIYISKCGMVYTINLKKNIIKLQLLGQDDVKCFTKLNNTIAFGFVSSKRLYSKPINTYNIHPFCDMNKEDKYLIDTFKALLTCTLVNKIVYVNDDNLAAIEAENQSNKHSLLVIHSVKNPQLKSFYGNCSEEFKSIISLKNNRIAILLRNEIRIYDIMLKLCIQTIQHTNKLILLENLDDKFMVVDDESNVIIYE